MVLVLSRAEDLKSFVVESIRATESLRPATQQRLPTGTKQLHAKAFQILVADGILNDSESTEIQQLVDFRNVIAHSVHDLTADLSRESIADDYAEFKNVKYNYDAPRKLKRYRELISERARSKYVLSLSLEPLLFEAADRTYEQELRRLKSKIKRLLAVRREESEKLNSEIAAVGEERLAEIGAGHPLNVASTGTLTTRGREVCRQLFALGLSDLAVAHLMHVSYRAIKRQRRASLQNDVPVEST